MGEPLSAEDVKVRLMLHGPSAVDAVAGDVVAATVEGLLQKSLRVVSGVPAPVVRGSDTSWEHVGQWFNGLATEEQRLAVSAREASSHLLHAVPAPTLPPPLGFLARFDPAQQAAKLATLAAAALLRSCSNPGRALSPRDVAERRGARKGLGREEMAVLTAALRRLPDGEGGGGAAAAGLADMLEASALLRGGLLHRTWRTPDWEPAAALGEATRAAIAAVEAAAAAAVPQPSSLPLLTSLSPHVAPPGGCAPPLLTCLADGGGRAALLEGFGGVAFVQGFCDLYRCALLARADVGGRTPVVGRQCDGVLATLGDEEALAAVEAAMEGIWDSGADGTQLKDEAELLVRLRGGDGPAAGTEAFASKGLQVRAEALGMADAARGVVVGLGGAESVAALVRDTVAVFEGVVARVLGGGGGGASGTRSPPPHRTLAEAMLQRAAAVSVAPAAQLRRSQAAYLLHALLCGGLWAREAETRRCAAEEKQRRRPRRRSPCLFGAAAEDEGVPACRVATRALERALCAELPAAWLGRGGNVRGRAAGLAAVLSEAGTLLEGAEAEAGSDGAAAADELQRLRLSLARVVDGIRSDDAATQAPPAKRARVAASADTEDASASALTCTSSFLSAFHSARLTKRIDAGVRRAVLGWCAALSPVAHPSAALHLRSASVMATPSPDLFPALLALLLRLYRDAVAAGGGSAAAAAAAAAANPFEAAVQAWTVVGCPTGAAAAARGTSALELSCLEAGIREAALGVSALALGGHGSLRDVLPAVAPVALQACLAHHHPDGELAAKFAAQALLSGSSLPGREEFARVVGRAQKLGSSATTVPLVVDCAALKTLSRHATLERDTETASIVQQQMNAADPRNANSWGDAPGLAAMYLRRGGR